MLHVEGHTEGNIASRAATMVAAMLHLPHEDGIEKLCDGQYKAGGEDHPYTIDVCSSSVSASEVYSAAAQFIAHNHVP